MDWGKLRRANDVQDKYDIFMELYKTGVNKYVPLYKPKDKGKQAWLNARCARAKKKETKHG